MKRIYFVRHGESEGNKDYIRQYPDTSLTEIGYQQARLLSERCRSLSVESIISSNMLRARQTTNFILDKLSRPVEYLDLFDQIKRSTEVLGTSKYDSKTIEIEKNIDKNFHIPDYRFSDEENFLDVKLRACKALKYLEQHESNNILVVTHGYVLKAILSYLLFGEELTSYEYKEIVKKFTFENTGITVLEYRGNDPTSWAIVSWNDCDHIV